MRKRFIIIAAAVVFVIGGAIGIASASIPGPDGVIHGCYKTSTGALTVIDSAASCPSGTTSLNWNQAGTGGSVGLDLQIVRASGTISVTATCPSSHPFIFGGGGFDASSVATGISEPDGGPAASEAEDGTGPHGWFFEAQNGANDTVVAYAICGK